MREIFYTFVKQDIKKCKLLNVTQCGKLYVLAKGGGGRVLIIVKGGN